MERYDLQIGDKSKLDNWRSVLRTDNIAIAKTTARGYAGNPQISVILFDTEECEEIGF